MAARRARRHTRETFWNDWDKYAFSVTIWNHRPLAVQMFAVAYVSGGRWNETGGANAELDAVVAEALTLADPEERREVMFRAQQIMQEEGITFQLYWRSLFIAQKAGLKGGGIHVSRVIVPRMMYWVAREARRARIRARPYRVTRRRGGRGFRSSAR